MPLFLYSCLRFLVARPYMGMTVSFKTHVIFWMYKVTPFAQMLIFAVVLQKFEAFRGVE